MLKYWSRLSSRSPQPLSDDKDHVDEDDGHGHDGDHANSDDVDYNDGHSDNDNDDCRDRHSVLWVSQ